MSYPFVRSRLILIAGIAYVVLIPLALDRVSFKNEHIKPFVLTILLLFWSIHSLLLPVRLAHESKKYADYYRTHDTPQLGNIDVYMKVKEHYKHH
jgi:hypothetical protein